jgi:hypothetical protein
LATFNGFGTHSFSAGGTGDNRFTLVNTTSGTGNYANLQVNAGTVGFGIYTFSQAYTTSGTNIQSATTLYQDSAGGLNIVAAHASGAIYFYSGGTALVWIMQANGPLRSGTVGNGNEYILLGQGTATIGVNGTGVTTSMYFVNGNGTIGTISHNGSVTAYNTSSDKRLKTDLGIATSIDVLKRTVIHNVEWRTEGRELARAIFAQDEYLHAPFGAVMPGKNDDLNSSGLPKSPWMVDYSKYVPDLIVGWHNHEARLVALEERMH